MSTLDRFLVGSLAAGTLWLTGAFGLSADAASTSRLTVVRVGADSIYNYDFMSKTASATNVDWPVTIIFRNNAEVNKVKNHYRDTWPCASQKYGRLMDDGTSYVWDSDGGAKNRCTLLGDVYHLRVYADGDDRLYNPEFGYWVYATTHIDHNEQLWGEWFGESERAEEWWRDWAVKQRRWTAVCDDCLDLKNAEAYRTEGKHRWRNSGYATSIVVP